MLCFWLNTVWITQFFVRVWVGLLHIIKDKVIIDDELGEGLANHRVDPVGLGHVSLLEFPVKSRLMVDQRHKDKRLPQAQWLAPDLDSFFFYYKDLFVDFQKLRH